MIKTYKNCQSCGMPLKKDPQGGGTESDGSKLTMYCSKCYVGGQFTRPDIDSPEKMQALVKDKLKGMGFPGPLAWLFSRGINRLERWKK